MDVSTESEPYITIGLPEVLFTNEICLALDGMLCRKYPHHIHIYIGKTSEPSMWVECSDDLDHDLLLDRSVTVVIRNITSNT